MKVEAKYEILPHTADVRLWVSAPDFQLLFETALAGMNHLLKPDFGKSGSAELMNDMVDIKSGDYSNLLIDFLSILLTKSHINKAIFEVLRYREFDETRILAEVRGYFVNGFDVDVKAVSYTETEIMMNKEDRLEATIVLDI